MIVIGLTGSIGMGKSTAAAMLREAGVPVHDSDATVHELYSGRAAPLVEAAFPGTTKDGMVDRQALSRAVIGHPEKLKRLEQIIHPLVTRARQAFLAEHRAKGTKIVVLDVPLLFETGLQNEVDVIVVVSAPEHIQRERVLARPNMDETLLAAILEKQVPDADKRARADYIIDTGGSFEAARAQVLDVLAKLNGKI